MNRHAMPHTFHHAIKRSVCALIASLCLGLAACGPAASPKPEEAPLFGASIGGPFELVDTAGKAVRWADFRGKYAIVYFGYAYCPDVCPTDVQRMSRGLADFEKAYPDRGASIQPVFITIDPERDTQAVVAEFIGNFHPRLIGLTGTPTQVKSAADAFRVFYSKGETPDSGNYLMDHSNITYLFGPDGKPIATLPTDLGPEAVAAELEKWVR